MACKSSIAFEYMELREQFSWKKAEYQEAAVFAGMWLAETFLNDEFWYRIAHIAKQMPDEIEGISEQNCKTLGDFIAAISVVQEPLVEWAKAKTTANAKQALAAVA